MIDRPFDRLLPREDGGIPRFNDVSRQRDPWLPYLDVKYGQVTWFTFLSLAG